MSLNKISHAKDVIGLLEAGYYTHVPIAYTTIKPSEVGGSEVINVKGRNVGSVYKSQPTFEVDFRGLVPIEIVVADELKSQNTFQLLLIIAGHSVPVSMMVATLSGSDRSQLDLNELYGPRTRPTEDQAQAEVLYIASGYLDEVHLVAEAGNYVEIRGILRADEIFVGGSTISWLGEDTSQLWSYLS